MSDPNTPKSSVSSELPESFGDVLTQFERSHAVKRVEGSREGTVVSVSSDSVVIDIGFKTEGVLPLSELKNAAIKPGNKLQVTIKGRDPQGYYDLTINKAAVTLSAPTSGPNAGMLFFQARNNTKDLTVSGNAPIILTGIVYAQNALMILSGGSIGESTDTGYTLFVVYRLKFAGGGTYHVNANFDTLGGGSPIKVVSLGE